MIRICAGAAAVVLALAAVFLFPRGPVGDEAAPPTSSTDPAEPLRAARVRPVEARDAPPTKVEAAPAPTVASVIRVLGRDGDAVVPVPGARVRAASSTSSWEGVADARGEARPPDELRRVPVTIWAGAADWSLVRVPTAEIDGAPVVVELSRGAAVRLSFRTPTDEEIPPSEMRSRYERAGVVAGARLVEEAAAASEPWNGPLSPLRCGPDAWQSDQPVEWTPEGARLASRLAPGRRRLVVARPGAPPFLSPPFDVASDDVVVRVEVPDPQPLRRVQFVDALDGRALAGVEVTPWLCLVKDFAYVPGAATRSDADGFAELPQPAPPAPPVRTAWSVVGATHAGEFDDALLAARPERPLVVKVFPSATIEGVAYGPPGVPAAASVVSWTSHGRAVRAACGADGRFRLEGVALRRAAAESVPVSVSHGRSTRFFAVDVAASGTASVVLGPSGATARVGRLAGRVSAGGRGLPGVHVVLAPTQDQRTLFGMATADDGSFSFESVPEGTARIRVACGDPRVSEAFRVATTTPVPIGADETTRLDFDLPDAAFRVVVLAADGGPAANARVVAKPLDPRGEETRFPGATFTPGWSAFTDARGQAWLPGLVPVAPHRIEATDAAGRTTFVEDALPGTTAAPADVKLALPR